MVEQFRFAAGLVGNSEPQNQAGGRWFKPSDDGDSTTNHGYLSREKAGQIWHVRYGDGFGTNEETTTTSSSTTRTGHHHMKTINLSDWGEPHASKPRKGLWTLYIYIIIYVWPDIIKHHKTLWIPISWWRLVEFLLWSASGWKFFCKLSGVLESQANQPAIPIFFLNNTFWNWPG